MIVLKMMRKRMIEKLVNDIIKGERPPMTITTWNKVKKRMNEIFTINYTVDSLGITEETFNQIRSDCGVK